MVYMLEIIKNDSKLNLAIAKENERYFFPSTAGATVFYIPSDMILLNVHAAVRP